MSLVLKHWKGYKGSLSFFSGKVLSGPLVSDSRPSFATMSFSRYRYSSTLVPYEAPDWAKGLANVPRYKVQLAHSNTPIHKWNLPGIPDDVEVYIKRDDLTGSTLSGNKVRKLEFIFAEAMQQGCKHVITCGGIQSNHCRATVTAAAQLGLKPHLVLRADIEKASDIGCQGNMLVNRLMGADMYFAPRVAAQETELWPRMEKVVQKIKAETGEDTYTIPVGGSNSIGFYGYLDAFRELDSQGVAESFDDIVFACGSGGTGEGLAVGNFLTGSKLQVHGIAVCDDAQYFHDHANMILKEVGVKDTRAEDILDIVEGYKGRGYGLSTEDELDFITKVSVQTGIILDPVYTGKAALGLVQELQKNAQRFRGKRILFIHTGGLLGVYDGRIESTLSREGSVTNQCYAWQKLDNCPFTL